MLKTNRLSQPIYVIACLAVAGSLVLSACGLALPRQSTISPAATDPRAEVPSPATVTPSPWLDAPTQGLDSPSETPQLSPTPLGPEGMLWLANPLDGNLRIVEPASASVAVIIPTGMRPDQVQVGEGAAWVLDRSADQVLRISLEDYHTSAIIPIPQGETDSLQVGEGFVWVAITERPPSNILLPSEEFTPQGGVLRIDPQTNQINGYTATGPVNDMTAAQGSLWVLGKGNIETPLLRVDPHTLEAVALSLEGTPDLQLVDSLAVTDDSLWLFSQSYGKLYRVSQAGRLYAEIVLGQHKPVSPADLLEESGMLWLAAPWGNLIAIDPRDDSIRNEIPLAVPLSGLAAAGNVLWAESSLEGQVFRVDPVSGDVTARVDTGPQLSPTPVLTATPIQRATRPCVDGPYSRLFLDERAHTLKEPAVPQRLHKEPGKETERAGWIQPGEHVRVLEGPACADGWVWWKVETLNGGYIGWATEGDEVNYWLIPD